MNRTLPRVLAALLGIASIPADAQTDTVMRAMRDELARSMNDLRLGELEPPYFVGYAVREVTDVRADASLGAMASSSETESRALHVEVRVGDRNLDNTNFYSRPSPGSFSTTRVVLPVEDDYLELRRAIWLATDSAYKVALDQISRKRAVLQNETVVEATPDFSVEDPFTHQGGPTLSAPDPSRVRALALELSAVFGDHADIHASSVNARALGIRVRYVNSEGSSFVRNDPAASVTVRATTRAPDGSEISDSFTAYGRTWERLPDRGQLLERSAALAARLGDLREAQVLDRYAGPILFEGQAAAELVRQVLLPRLLVQRAPHAERRMRQTLERLANPFQDKLGSRVLPRFLAITDDPTLSENEQGPLWGGYAVDDEGVPARETTVVRRGMLRTLLSTRNPIEGISQSSGHMRAGGSAPSNLLVSSSDGLTADEMSEEFRALVEERELEYGIIVRRLRASSGSAFARGPSGPSRGDRSLRAVVAVKAFADGREELVRQAVLTGLSEGSFRDIVAASEAVTNHTIAFRPSGSFDPLSFMNPARRYGALASLVVPSLLFEDVSARRPPGNIPLPPVVPKP